MQLGTESHNCEPFFPKSINFTVYFTTLLQAEKKKVEPDKPKDDKPKKKLIGE